jgi:hypothetical protein
MRFEGNSLTITNLEELEEFAKIVSEAWAAHKEQIPKIINPANLSGH